MLQQTSRSWFAPSSVSSPNEINTSLQLSGSRQGLRLGVRYVLSSKGSETSANPYTRISRLPVHLVLDGPCSHGGRAKVRILGAAIISFLAFFYSIFTYFYVTVLWRSNNTDRPHMQAAETHKQITLPTLIPQWVRSLPDLVLLHPLTCAYGRNSVWMTTLPLHTRQLTMATGISSSVQDTPPSRALGGLIHPPGTCEFTRMGRELGFKSREILLSLFIL
jgi:hypothetical protein